MNKEEYKKYKIKQYYKNKSKDEKIVDKYRVLRKNDIIYRIIYNLSSRLKNKLNELKITKNFKYTEILGCSTVEFKSYLEKLLNDNMTFENYGEWEIDHIIPFSSFNFNNFDDIKKCCNYTNLQPLWKTENRQKYNKVICDEGAEL